jgi:hypothetical protein
MNRGRILGRNPDKSLNIFPPCYSQSPLQLCLEYTVKEKGGKPDRKPYPLPYGGLRNPYRNPKSENSQDYAQKPLQTFMNSASEVGRQKLVFVLFMLYGCVPTWQLQV